MEVKINVEDYLSDEEIKEIVMDEIRCYFREELRGYASVEILLGNVGYETFIKAGCEAMKLTEQEVQSKITQHLTDLLNDEKSYRLQIFRRKDRYTTEEDGIDTKILDDVLSSSRPIIERKVNEIIENYPFYEVKENIRDTIYDCIEKRLFGSKEA